MPEMPFELDYGGYKLHGSCTYDRGSQPQIAEVFIGDNKHDAYDMLAPAALAYVEAQLQDKHFDWMEDERLAFATMRRDGDER